MKLAVGFNPVFPATEGAEIAMRAEEYGYDSLWMHESLFQRDIITYLSMMASSTKTLRVASGVINTFTRHPVTAAATFASLAELSGGRVNMGLGLGSFPTIPLIGHQIFPVDKSKPLKRIREYVEVVRKVWAGGKVEFEGEFFRVHNLELGFKIAQPIPLFIASLSPKTQAFAAANADGVILSPALNTVRGTEKMLENVKKGEAAGGKQVVRASYMLTSVDQDAQKSRDVIRDYYFFVYQLAEVVKPEALAPYGISVEMLAPFKEAWKKGDIAGAKKVIPDEAIEVLTISGGADHAMDRVREYAGVGVTLPILMPVGNVDYAMRALSPKVQ